MRECCGGAQQQLQPAGPLVAYRPPNPGIPQPAQHRWVQVLRLPARPSKQQVEEEAWEEGTQSGPPDVLGIWLPAHPTQLWRAQASKDSGSEHHSHWADSPNGRQ